jgi:hypothetical protein
MPGPGAPARAVTGGSELEIAVSTGGRYVVVGTNGGYAFSSDGGRTWTESGVGCPAGFTACNGDPSLAVGLSGAFYYAIIGWPTGANTQDPAGTASTVIYRSTNNGQAFAFVANAVVCNNSGPGSCFPDQEHITADRNLAGAGGGDQVYSTWRNFDTTDQDPALVCSQDGGQNWSAPVNVGSGFVPRIAIGGDGFVYVVYRSGGNIMVNKYSPCSAGLVQQVGFPVAVTSVTDVTCPVAGLDRCNDGNILSSHTVAVDDVNPQRVYLAYADNTAAGLNEDVIVRASTDGGLTWPAAAQLNSTGNARRYMPWACSVGGAAYVTWYDRRFGIPGVSQDLTDFFGGSAQLDGSGALVPGPEFRISGVSDPNCDSGWPCAPRATGDSESCPAQPQLAGGCGDGAPNTPDSGLRCDFTSGPSCPAGEVCLLGGGCPKYGDYNGNACAAGRLFVAWASATAPPAVTPASTGIDTFTDSRVVCCVPQVQTSGAIAFGTACSGATVTKDLELCNQGKEVLQVTGITSSSPRYTVAAPVPGYPIDVAPGSCQTLQVSFSPTASGAVPATLSIASNDPVYPTLTVSLSGTGGQAVMATAMANAGSFGDVCVADFVDLPLTIANTGSCSLTVSGITSSSAEFVPPGVSSFPLTVEAGNAIEVPVRFQPASQTPPPKSATITVDALNATDKLVSVSGSSSPPDLDLTGSGDFGAVCAGVSAERTVSVCNTGACPLDVASVAVVQQASDAPCLDFAIQGSPFPASVAAGSCVPLTVKYTPQSLGAHACRLKVTTGNDPDEPVVYLPLAGSTPAPQLTVAPDQAFAPTVIQSVGACSSALPFPVANTGSCPVTVESIAIGGTDASNYSFSGAPGTPITVQAGEQVGDGALATVFRPDVLDRDRLGTASVTWLSDPIAATTTTVVRQLCGEATLTGARVLVRVGGAPVPLVERISIQRMTGNRNNKVVDTVDQARNLPLQTWSPAPGTACQPFQYHREYGTVDNPLMLAPGSYTVTATVLVGKKKTSKTVAFDATACTFNPTVIVDF